MNEKQEKVIEKKSGHDNNKQASENLNIMLNALKKGNIPKDKMEYIIDYVIKISEIESKYQAQKDAIKGDVRFFIKASLEGSLYKHLGEYNINKFDVDGQKGLNTEEEKNYSIAISESITQIILLGGLNKFSSIHHKSASKTGILNTDKYIADKINLKSYVYGDGSGKNYTEKLVQRAGNISEEKLKILQENKFYLNSPESWGELGILLVKEFGSGVEDVLKFLTNIPSGVILTPRYIKNRYDINFGNEKDKINAEINLKELVEDNASLGLLELVGEKGPELLKKLGEMLISGKQGDIAMMLVTIAGLIAGGAGAVKLGLNLARKATVKSARKAGRIARKEGKTTSRTTRKTLKTIGTTIGMIGSSAGKIDDIVGGAGIEHLTGSISRKLSKAREKIIHIIPAKLAEEKGSANIDLLTLGGSKLFEGGNEIFPDSKIQHVVYRGTAGNGFDDLSAGTNQTIIDGAVFFTSDQNAAERYMKDNTRLHGGEGRIINVRVDLQKPFYSGGARSLRSEVLFDAYIKGLDKNDFKPSDSKYLYHDYQTILDNIWDDNIDVESELKKRFSIEELRFIKEYDNGGILIDIKIFLNSVDINAFKPENIKEFCERYEKYFLPTRRNRSDFTLDQVKENFLHFSKEELNFANNFFNFDKTKYINTYLKNNFDGVIISKNKDQIDYDFHDQIAVFSKDQIYIVEETKAETFSELDWDNWDPKEEKEKEIKKKKEYIASLGETQRALMTEWANKFEEFEAVFAQKIKKNLSGNIDVFDLFVIDQYAFEAYKINQHLRKQDLDKRNLAFINQLDSTLQKIPVFHGITYRGVFMSKVVFDKILVEKLYTDKGYTSSSRDVKIAENFSRNGHDDIDKVSVLFEIQGTSGKNFSELGMHRKALQDEKEILFGRDTKFEVINVEKRKNDSLGKYIYHVKLKEIAI